MSKKQLDLFNVKMMGGVAAPFKGQDKDTKDKSINPSDEKTLYISGYEKRIKEMRTAYISTGCLIDVGALFVLLMNLD